MLVKSRLFRCALAAALGLAPVAANAQLALSEVIVELKPGAAMREDVEMTNLSTERLYVLAEPREIVSPGTPDERDRRDPDPEKLGLLVSPSRSILEAGQHKLLRVAVLGGASDRERIYRVTVKPVVGDVTSKQSGLKLLVGYDMLVLVRPSAPRVQIEGTREGDVLVIRNRGNSSVEMFAGKQCFAVGKCAQLPSRRLYAGAELRVALSGSGPVQYSVKSVEGTVDRRF